MPIFLPRFSTGGAKTLSGLEFWRPRRHGRHGGEFRLEIGQPHGPPVGQQPGPHHREGQIVPRDILPGEQPGLERLLARPEIGRDHLRAVDHRDMVAPEIAVDRQQRIDANVGQRFFMRFARRAFDHGFAKLHIAAGQAPISLARIDAAADEQDLAVMHGDDVIDDQRILIGDVIAFGADQPLVRVAGRDQAQARPLAATGAARAGIKGAAGIGRRRGFVVVTAGHGVCVGRHGPYVNDFGAGSV